MWQKMLQVGSGGGSKEIELLYSNLSDGSPYTFTEDYSSVVFISARPNNSTPTFQLNGNSLTPTTLFLYSGLSAWGVVINNVKSGDVLKLSGGGPIIYGVK